MDVEFGNFIMRIARLAPGAFLAAGLLLGLGNALRNRHRAGKNLLKLKEL